MIHTEGKNFSEVVKEIFATLIKQGKPCTVKNFMGNDVCAYGDEEGNHCAIGWLLEPDRKEWMRSSEGIITLLPKLRGDARNAGFIEEHLNLLEYVQGIHDQAQNIFEEPYIDPDLKEVLNEETLDKIKEFYRVVINNSSLKEGSCA